MDLLAAVAFEAARRSPLRHLHHDVHGLVSLLLLLAEAVEVELQVREERALHVLQYAGNLLAFHFLLIVHGRQLTL